MDMGSLFSAQEVAAITGAVMPPAPKDYKLPTEFPPLYKARRIALDLESYDPDIKEKGPGWRRDAFRVGVSVAAEWPDGTTFGEYYPTRHRGGPNLPEDKVDLWLGDNLAFYRGEIVGANLLYDSDGLQYQGVVAPLAKWRDVQWAEALLDESAMNYTLDRIASKRLNKHKVTDELKALYGPEYKYRFAEIHPGHARAYGLGDVFLPLEILSAQEKELKREHLLDLFDLESRLLPFLIYMRRIGVRVDMDKARGLGTTFTAKRDECLAECTKLSGVEINEENMNSAKVIAMALDHLGIPYPRIKDKDGNDTSKPSIKDQWLERLDHPFGASLATANKYEKAKGTFVNGYVLDYAIGDRVHCEFHPLRKVDADDEGGKGKSNGTVSGRFSGTHPNLQNIPARDEEIGPLCRGMFVADEDKDWWSLDYSQIEYRFLIHYAVVLGCKGADKPQAMYKKNPDTDFHEMCAELVWAVEWLENKRKYEAGEITKKEYLKECKRLRKPAKNLNFGMVYGMGEDKLGRSLGETEIDEHGIERANAKAKAIMAKYHEGAPFIKDVTKKCTDEAQDKGYITTILGRRSRFDLWEPRYTERDAKGQRKYVEALPLEQAREKYGLKLKRSGTNKALNRRLQGSAADLMKLAMVLMWEAGVFADPELITCVLTVHDELNGSKARTPAADEAMAEVKRIMETAMTLEVPVLTSGSTGANWAEAK